MSRPKRAPRPAPEGEDEFVPLSASQLARVNAAACDRRGGGEAEVREPSDNVYGDYKVLARVDGLSVVHALHGPTFGLVFWTEKGARAWAKAASERG